MRKGIVIGFVICMCLAATYQVGEKMSPGLYVEKWDGADPIGGFLYKTDRPDWKQWSSKLSNNERSYIFYCLSVHAARLNELEKPPVEPNVSKETSEPNKPEGKANE